MAVGQPTFITRLENATANILLLDNANVDQPNNKTPHDGHHAWEWWSAFQRTDNISVTLALLYLERSPRSAP